MRYESLKKLYYLDRASYEQEYQSRIHGVSSTVLDFNIGDSPAFYVSTEEMSRLIYQILSLDKKVSQTRSLLPTQAIQQYYHRSMIEEVFQTLDIEKVYSTRKEIADTYRERKEDKLLGMITKYGALFRTENIPLKTCADVRALYDEICLPEVARESADNAPDGQYFRKNPVNVYTKTDQIIHSGLFPESKIIDAMERALGFLQDDAVDMLKRIAAFHYMLGYIHPFYDGNGRLARFISSYLLSRELDTLIGVRLSYTINMGKNQYYRMFKETNDPKNRGDLTPFILGFLEILLTSYTNLYEALQGKEHALRTYTGIIDQRFKDKKQAAIAFLLMQVSLFGAEGLTLKEIVEHSDVGYPTVDKFLKAEGCQTMVYCKKDGKRKLYSLNLSWLDQQMAETEKPSLPAPM